MAKIKAEKVKKKDQFEDGIRAKLGTVREKVKAPKARKGSKKELYSEKIRGYMRRQV